MVRIFLAHASEDKEEVTRLYYRLKQKGFQPWLDKVDLRAGQNWRSEIPKAIQRCDVFLACLSQKSILKKGYVQKEFKLALNRYAEMPPDAVYLIPLRLDRCDIPELRQEEYGINLRDIHWIDYFETDGFEQLVKDIDFSLQRPPQKSGLSSKKPNYVSGKRRNLFQWLMAPKGWKKSLLDYDIPLLGTIPLMLTRSARAVPILVQPDSVYHSSYERCLSQLSLIDFEGSLVGPRVVVVTSTNNLEGKSVTAYNLAIVAAQSGRRTLLLEADLRTGSKAEILGLMSDPQSILEPLRYYSGQVGNNLQMVSFVEDLYLTPSPGPQRKVFGILESAEMYRFLQDTRTRFDMVILDTPALSHTDDAMLLTKQADGMILVIRPAVTKQADLNQTLAALKRNKNNRLLGAIVNGKGSVKISPEDLEPIGPEFHSTYKSGRIDF